MREARARELGGMTTPLVDLIRLTSTAMGHATAALFSTDPPAAESIAAASETVSALRHELEDHAAVLLALRAQARVPELPTTIAAVHVNAEAERWGNWRGRSPISPGPGVPGRRYRPHFWACFVS